MSVLLFACSLYAQSDSIFLNGTELRIGMSKADVLSKLLERNDLVKMKGPGNLDAWCVRAKDDRKTLPCGGDNIQFVEERLVVVARHMGETSTEDAAAMISSLFASLDALRKSGKTDLTFTTQEIESDDHIRYRIVSFIAGAKEYTFYSQQPVGQQPATKSSVSLVESFVPSSK
jgi:hypothetical protein